MLSLPEITETLEYIADHDLRHVIKITENVHHFPEEAALKNAVFGLMVESLKALQLDLRKLALQVQDLDTELRNVQ